ncbi:hypothetical protein Q5P01_025837 [Channa striata]|uniref:EF-hand domain-containing protein n=1 Tax=Channa striata TaxID=64152 RepID=A0AA88IQA9_CHASR|nr:hypothetical protein Q5P01_025837 [Channa striata]
MAGSDVRSDGFSLQTCHNIISLLDMDGSGKLGLMEFHALWTRMQRYLEIFQSHDTDRFPGEQCCDPGDRGPVRRPQLRHRI